MSLISKLLKNDSCTIFLDNRFKTCFELKSFFWKKITSIITNHQNEVPILSVKDLVLSF